MKRWLDASIAVGAAAIVVLAGLLLGSGGDAIDEGGAPRARAPDAGAPRVADSPVSDVAPRPAGVISVVTDPDVEPEPAAAAERDPLAILVFGTVRDSTGKPVERPDIEFRDEQNRRHEPNCTAGGSYTFAGVTPGTWKILCAARGHGQLRDELIVETSSRLIRKDLVFRRTVMLKIRILMPDGRPLLPHLAELRTGGDLQEHGDLDVLATADPLGGDLPVTERFRQHRPGSLGTWRSLRTRWTTSEDLAGMEGVDGILELGINLPVHVSVLLRHIVLETRLVLPGAETVTFTIPPEKVTGQLGSARLRIVDAGSQEPLAGVRVRLDPDSRMTGGQVTGEDGMARFEDLVPGLSRLEAVAPGRERIDHSVRIAAGRETDLGTIGVSESTGISGSVVDDAGRPLGGLLRWIALDRIKFPQLVDASTRTSSDGSFELKSAGRDRQLLVFEDPDHAVTPLLTDTSAGPVSGVRLVVPAGTKVSLSSHPARATTFLFLLRDARGSAFWTSQVTTPWKHSLRLAPGRYRAEAHVDAGLLTAVDFEVGTTPVRVTVAP